ncbi:MULTISPECIES: hypothetical protein [Nocardioides]|uniref:Uncharacterized protein n=1 Tax=Nocardioides vastitatis TaxID=2568655 RepID=A0ABW0ZFA1_9ACTN|nr:hypothetical protein [Nocardioides sp.]THJ02374.1 hypothetical protein E7Z54_10600 [Nocardioides sp.]
MLPRFEIVDRQRPVAVVGVPFLSEQYDGRRAPSGATAATPHLAPYAAIEVGLRPGAGSAGPTTLSLTGEDDTRLSVHLHDRKVSLSVARDGSETRHRSRRHGRCATEPTRLALALTGRHLAVLTLERGSWVVRGRVDLGRTGRRGSQADTRDVDWLAGLTSSWATAGSTPGVTDWSAGAFGQLGLRDLRLVTNADGSPYRAKGGDVLFTATSAGPGFFDTAHTSVWTCPPDAPTLRHTADLYFERSDRPGAWGDHATHLVRDGDRWLVATSTWADFPSERRERKTATVGITLAESTADLTQGQHRLPTRPLSLPTRGPSVGVWDPHLVRTPTGGAGEWLVGYVSARRFFDFHPVLASGPSLDDLTLRGAATDRRATEGTTLVRVGPEWRVLASDGRDSPRRVRARYPVFDLGLAEVGVLQAPYPTNIPWPSLVPPAAGAPEDDWLLVTFNGRPYGGPLVGYGTHGEVVVMRPR